MILNTNPRVFTPPRILTPNTMGRKSLHLSKPDDAVISGTEFRKKSLRSPGSTDPLSIYGIGNINGNRNNSYGNNENVSNPISPLTPAESAFAKSKKMRNSRGGGGGGGGGGEGGYNHPMTNKEVEEDIERDKENSKLSIMEEIEMEIKIKMAINRDRNMNVNIIDEEKEIFVPSSCNLNVVGNCISGRRRAYSTMTHLGAEVPVTFMTPTRQLYNEEVQKRIFTYFSFSFFSYFIFQKLKDRK